MHHKNIIIKGLRGLSEIKIEDLQQVNLFVGKNNCGKTSVLEGLFMITGISNPKIPIALNEFRNINYALGDDKDFNLIFNDLDIEKGVEIVSETMGKKRFLKIKPHYFQNKEEIRHTFEKNSLKNLDIDSYNNDDVITGLDYDFTVQNKKYKTSIIQNGVFFDQIYPRNYKEKLVGNFINPNTILDLLPKYLNKLIVKKQKDFLLEVLQQIEPSIRDISIGTNKAIYCDNGLEELVQINVMGDGIIRVLSLVVMIASMKNGCVFIDEIENGLHYETLEIIWKTIFKVAKKYNVQIFATTHSYECITAFQKAFEFDLQPQAPDEIRLFRIEKQTDKHIVHKMTNENLKVILKDEWEVR